MSSWEILMVALIAAALVKLLYSSWDNFKSINHVRQKNKEGNSSENESDQDLTKENEKQEFDIYRDAQFVNKDCKDLESFVINDEINEYDLRKLTDLNQIPLHIAKGWYPAVIQLIIELSNNGWDKKVVCIKEKYASLRFHLSSSNEKLNEIVEKYEGILEYVCEKCGERGEKRHSKGWDYVACRRHYLETRDVILMEKSGMRFNGTFHLWRHIRTATLENKDLNGNYLTLVIKFNNQWADPNRLNVNGDTIGFGTFLKNLPKTFKDLDYDYITKNYSKSVFCEICGYKATYIGKCECCENDSWTNYQIEWDAEPGEKRRYLVEAQIKWELDEGEHYEKKENNYLKNPDHKIVFSQKELNEYNARIL